MPGSKRNPNAPGSDESPATIAMLAAQFLPRIELPEGWTTEHQDVLRRAIGKPTGNPFPANPEYVLPPHLRTQWEVICEEAVKRTRTLLEIAAGRTRPEVLKADEENARGSEEAKRNDRAAEELRKEFDSLAEGATSLPVNRVLKYCMPRVKTAELRMAYFMAYLRYSVERSSLRESLGEDYKIADQTRRTVERGEFPVFVSGFMKAYTEHGDAWRKAISRKAGKKGQKRLQEAEESHGHTATDLTPEEIESLDAAAGKHTAKKPRK